MIMGYYNDEVEGLFDGYNGNDNVAGAFDRGDFNDDNFRFRVIAIVNRRDFCRAVRRCLRDDLVAGAQDENRNRHRRNCRY